MNPGDTVTTDHVTFTIISITEHKVKILKEGKEIVHHRPVFNWLLQRLLKDGATYSKANTSKK